MCQLPLIWITRKGVLEQLDDTTANLGKTGPVS